jgi:hypothetical protein
VDSAICEYYGIPKAPPRQWIYTSV